jgi:hypothetical protein
MVHKEEDQRLLDSLSEQDKLDRTTLKAFKSRGNLLRNYDKRYLTNNEMPHK